MKRIGLFLLAVVMVAGLAGCSSSSNDNLSASDIAGTYAFSSVSTGGVTLAPPSISGSITFTSSGTLSGSITFQGEGTDGISGTYTVADPSITLNLSDGETINGTISNNGSTLTFNSTDGETGAAISFVLTKQ